MKVGTIGKGGGSGELGRRPLSYPTKVGYGAVRKCSVSHFRNPIVAPVYPRRTASFVFLAFLLGALSLCSSGALTPVPEVLKMTRDAGKTVTLRGVVTYPNSKRVHFYLHDGKAGIIVNCDPSACPQFSDEVEVTGAVSGDGAGVWVNADAVKVIGPGKLPAPLRPPLGEAGTQKYFRQWVEVEGVVLQARYQKNVGSVIFHLAGENGWCIVNALIPPPGDSKGWWGARVRVQGVNTGNQILNVRFDKPEFFSVLEPGRTDPFSAPAQTVNGLRGGRPDASRVKLTATVMDVADGWMTLRDATGGFRADFLYPYVEDSTWKPSEGGVRIPELVPGQQVEIVGSPMVTVPSLMLRYAQVRVVGAGAVPEPRPISMSEVPRNVDELVTLRGRMQEYSSGTYAPGRWREVIDIVGDGRHLEVAFETDASSAKLAGFKADEWIEATGFLRAEEGTPPFRLRLRSAKDARSLGLAPEVIRERQIRAYSIAGGIVLVAALGLFVFGRRQARERLLQAERTRAEDALRALKAEREVGELKTRFVSLVSHEFRTPLGVTMSAVELLRNYMDRLPVAKRDELLNDIHHSTLRMASMMEQVLLLGRVEAGKLSYQSVPVDLAELVGKLTDESLSATNRKCPVEYFLQGDLSGAAGDEGMMRHIFANLLSNAVKYSEPGTRVEFSVRREGDTAVFSVRDHGIGIPPADQARLFEAFHRAGNVGETPGTGLGLLIVKRCVELHHGTIGFDSQVGEGTTFTVRLPLFRL